MPGPMEGVRVVELAVWVAGPSAAAILCDWGADVIKIEPPEGDPFRGLMALAGTSGTNPPFELDNRGKRSIALDLRTDEGRAIAYCLTDRADVFVSNLRPGALARLGLDHETLRARNPRLVYAHMSGYGMGSADEDRAAYDVGAFWSRAGVAAMLTPPGKELPIQRGGMGDHTAGSQAAGAIAAALYHREKTGEGQLITASLARTGAYTLGWDLNTALLTGIAPRASVRDTFPNPLILDYPVKGGRWIWLLMLQGDRHWPDFCRAVGREEWLDDPRFATLTARAQNATALIRAIEDVLAERTLDEWAPIFDRENVWWAPVQSLDQVVDDPVMAAAGAWVDVPMPEGTARMVATPVDFHGTPWQPRAGAPELGQHTEEVLLELGYDWDGITALKERGVIP
jgi:crotonobetainyl-CoA:carnitine CoA-transferase CaiB-like acyl-CoA transferase